MKKGIYIYIYPHIHGVCTRACVLTTPGRCRMVVGLPGIKELPNKDCPIHHAPCIYLAGQQTQQRRRQVKYIYYRQLHTQRTPLPPTHATTTPFSRHTRQSRRPVLTRRRTHRQTDRQTHVHTRRRQTNDPHRTPITAARHVGDHTAAGHAQTHEHEGCMPNSGARGKTNRNTPSARKRITEL